MPIKPPNLDDRRYDDIVREARALIPQYCPQWSNLSDADPGITLVQLFAWMTEMTIYRLNRVPDKTYIHFLNFIGEERRQATPATVPVTFYNRHETKKFVDVPAFTRCSTKQQKGADALHFLTTETISVHEATVERVVAVRAGKEPMVREIPFKPHDDSAQALLFNDGNGVQVFSMDPIEHGPRAYTPYQFLYLSHDDFRAMNFPPGRPQMIGKIQVRTSSEENLPIAALFKWEYFKLADGWSPVDVEEEEDEVLGLPEITLKGHLWRQDELPFFGLEGDEFDKPEALKDDPFWLRATVDYEKWLAHRMSEDMEITWRDDRGGEERLINNWDVKETGRYLEFFIQDMPPIRGGWTVKFTVVDRSMPAGRNAYFPKYRFSHRRGERWEEIPFERVRYQGTSIILTGPFQDMANDGYNLRAERIETVNLMAFMPNLELELTWLRPVVVHLAAGPETSAAAEFDATEMPVRPWQPAVTLPPLLGMKFFIGSDLLENRAMRPVMLELEVGFELEAQLIEEPDELYHMQLTYRAADTWRVLHTEDGRFAEFTFSDLDPEGALEKSRRKIRIFIEPKTQLKGVCRSIIAGVETCWLRIEFTKAAMTHQADKTTPPQPISVKIWAAKLGVDGIIGRDVYEQPMPGLKVATVEYREHNRRLTRLITRSSGRLSEAHPFDDFIDVADDEAANDESKAGGHHALYMKLDRPLPPGQRHAFSFRTRGETYLPEGMQVNWEMLEDSGHGRLRWGRLTDPENAFPINRSGVLEFAINEEMEDIPEPGVWLRCLYRAPEGSELLALPPMSHIMTNTVDAVNLHEFRVEKFSGEGIPHQSLQLRRFPVYLHSDDPNSQLFPHPDRFADIRVYVREGADQKEWRVAPGNSLLTASKDDRVFTVDTVEGTLHFGNGIRGKMLPVGNYNVVVELYNTVPGDVGNIAPGQVHLPEGFADLVGVGNILPATGGRNAESIEEIIRRAPSVLTSRDRAVTRLDFEIIGKEASGEVARAACDGRMSDDGVVGVVVLPQRRDGEKVPDPFLSTGLKEHVQRYLGKRCLVNVRPEVRLATFQEVDVAVTLRLRPNANFLQVRDKATKWVETFLDAYDGGLDKSGWPFQGTLFAQDFGRMVSDIAEVRHVVKVQVYPVREGIDSEFPGWERGQGMETVVLDAHDLFSIRFVRISSEEDEE